LLYLGIAHGTTVVQITKIMQYQINNMAQRLSEVLGYLLSVTGLNPVGIMDKGLQRSITYEYLSSVNYLCKGIAESISKL